MKFTRRKRIALELLGPPLLAAGSLDIVGCIVDAWIGHLNFTAENWFGQIFGWGLVMLIYAYLFAGIPSIIYAAVMEWRFARGLDPKSWRTVGWSSVLGVLSGVEIGACLSRFGGPPGFWVFYGGLGLAVGFVLGLLIKRWSAQPEARDEGSPA
jgi:hypothetical protein